MEISYKVITMHFICILYFGTAGGSWVYVKSYKYDIKKYFKIKHFLKNIIFHFCACISYHVNWHENIQSL